MSSGRWQARRRSRPPSTKPREPRRHGARFRSPSARPSSGARSMPSSPGGRDRTELTWQMGRPVRYTPNEVAGFEERPLHDRGGGAGSRRRRRRRQARLHPIHPPRVPLGVAFIIAPWNYPYLTAVNAVVPALMAGNAVILKHSAQTPLCAERIGEAPPAGLPAGLFQHLHLSDADRPNHRQRRDRLRLHRLGRRRTQRAGGGSAALSSRSDWSWAARTPRTCERMPISSTRSRILADGAFFNSGSPAARSSASTCTATSMTASSMVWSSSPAAIVWMTDRSGDHAWAAGPARRRRVRARPDRRGAGGRSDRASGSYGLLQGHPASAYMAPQVLTGVDHTMRIMTEETFGPAVGVMPVASDDEAIRLMNDSRYGLTAAIWTADADAAIRIGDRVATGTWFMNRCDYLDRRSLDRGQGSGRGCSLSRPSTSVSPVPSRSICARRPEWPRPRTPSTGAGACAGATVGPERCRVRCRAARRSGRARSRTAPAWRRSWPAARDPAPARGAR